MKKLVLLLARYILQLLLLLAVSYAFLTVYFLARTDASISEPLVAIQPELMRALFVLLIPLVLITAISALFTIVHSSTWRFVQRLVLALVISASLFAVFMAYAEWYDVSKDLPDRISLQGDQIYAGNKLFVVMDSIDANGAKGIWYRLLAPDQKIKYAERGELVDSGRVLQLIGSNVEVDTRTLNGSMESLFAKQDSAWWDISIEGLSSHLYAYLQTASSTWWLALLHSVTLAFVIVGMWLWVRLSRWPLWNLVCCLVWLTGIYFLLALFLEPGTKSILATLNPLAPDLAIPALWLVISVIFLLLALLLPPFKDWKKELGA